MTRLQQIIAYFCLNYPYKAELSKARLTKLVYLADWVSSLLTGKQMSDIRWVFNHYGPYVDDVVEAAASSHKFNIEAASTVYGSAKSVISYKGSDEEITLSEPDRIILDALVERTKGMYFNDFLNYVYSTYPVKSNERYSTLNLESIAKKYNEEREGGGGRL